MRSIIKLLSWLAANTRLLYCFLLALLIHVVLIAAFGWMSFGAVRSRTVALFDASTVPLPSPNQGPATPTTADRDGDNSIVGAGGGAGGQGPGGMPTTAGGSSLEAYQAHLAALSSQPGPDSVNDVIGIVHGEAAALERPEGGPSDIGMTTGSGLGGTGIGAAGVKGPGGGMLGFRMGVKPGGNLNQSSSSDTERAILTALRWLAAHQAENGSWNCGRSALAGTALATLAFLGHGETPDSPEFGGVIGKALEYLASHVGSDGLISESSADYIGSDAQGMVTLAMAEAYRVTPSPALRDPLERSVRAIIRAQSAPKAREQHVGGWRYRPTSDDADVSVTGWMILALTSAKAVGVAVPPEVGDKAAQFLWNMYDTQNPGFGYQSPERSPSMTAIGVLCEQLLGNGNDPRITTSRDYLREQKAEWDKTRGDYVLYGWFYITQAMSQAGGSYWKPWEEQIRDVLLKEQRSDGRWMPPPNSTMEMRDLAATPAYATALGALILETTPAAPPGVPADGKTASPR
ncbi:MAG TPA: prenyltransferase/squalene oxidase repeat-containing protein [Verrucomicrobiae bacterium]|nr:prenyltransferase/squalene oxidase repeat-containing protein [Verrucomicrobiae bacterium]